MNILIALTYYRPHYSGLTIYAEREALALKRRGHQVTILTSRFSQDLQAREVQDGILVVRPKVQFHISKGVIMLGMPIQAWKLIREADVVHLHVPQLDAALIALMCKLLGKPVVLTYHCDLRLPKGLVHAAANLVSNLANEITARCADLIVTNTQDYAESSSFLRRYIDKIIPIYPPVEVEPVSESDLTEFRLRFNLLPNQHIIGMAARLATEKGVEYLVEALPRVIEELPDVRVLFVGPYQAVVGEEQYAARIMPGIESIGDHWKFLGVLQPVDMAAFFHVCDVIVLPSLNSTESFGIVQVEAMTCGTPVIASNLPGVRIPVSMTGSGLLIEPGQKEALSHALIQVLKNPVRFHGHTETLIGLSKPELVAEQYETLFELTRAPESLNAEIKRRAAGNRENYK